MRMNLPPDRQGHLSDITSKTLGELKELLERQEKILTRSEFIKTLPDKGERCRTFADYLRSLVAQRSGSTADKKTRMSDLTQNSDSKDSRVPMEVMGQVKERTEENVELTESLQKLSIGRQERRDTAEPELVQNAYERVVRKVEERPNRERFMPNRIPKSISEATAQHSRPHPPPPSVKPASTQQHKAKISVPEESNVRPPQYKFNSSKMISISESVKLIDEQRARNEKLVAENAAQRLAAQILPKMAAYSGGKDMRYRTSRLPEQGDSDDEDDDDEEREIDYGDEDD